VGTQGRYLSLAVEDHDKSVHSERPVMEIGNDFDQSALSCPQIPVNKNLSLKDIWMQSHFISPFLSIRWGLGVSPMLEFQLLEEEAALSMQACHLPFLSTYFRLFFLLRSTPM
jgi:hypothetical protein